MNPYKRLAELKIPVKKTVDASPIEYVEVDSIISALIRNSMSVDKFNELFGSQTCIPEGLYPWDVEAVLERMMSGALTGTQLMPD